MLIRFVKKHAGRKALLAASTLAFGALLALAGCTTEAEIILPAQPPKLVVTSFISPEATDVEVCVSKAFALTSPENNGKFKPVENATVWLSDGLDSVQILYSSDSLYRTSSFPIIPGKRYTLRVTTPDGFATQAACTVPLKINQSLTGRIDSSFASTPTLEGNYALELRWDDLPGEGDFYRIEGITEIRVQNSAGSAWLRRNELGFIDDKQVTDTKADGRSWQNITDNIWGYRQEQRSGNLRKVQGFLYTTDRAYFEYHRSVYRYQLSTNFSDPIKIYSNVKGGLGVFGAYRAYAIEVPVR